jgi:hypothetical protein
MIGTYKEHWEMDIITSNPHKKNAIGIGPSPKHSGAFWEEHVCKRMRDVGHWWKGTSFITGILVTAVATTPEINRNGRSGRSGRSDA